MKKVLIKDIREQMVFVALKRICNHILDFIWKSDWGNDELGLEHKLAVKKSREYEKDIIELSKIDFYLNWGQIKVKRNDGWSIKDVGNFNPWYNGDVSLNNFINSLEPIFEFIQISDDHIEEAEFKHYFEFLRSFLSDPEVDFWSLIHPLIKQVSLSRFQSGHYSDASRGAMVEIEDRLRSLVKLKTGEEISGDKLIRAAFSPQKPIVKLADVSNQVGIDIQRGYMEMFAGAMTGIRNPNSHKNLTIDKKEAIHILFLTSLFMSKIDESENILVTTFKGKDPEFEQIVQFAKQNGSISASLIQRKFSIGYARSARILDELDKLGILGPFDPGKPRKVIK